MNPWKFLEKVYYINLDSRPDRNEQTIKEFESVNLTEYTRVPGIVYKGFGDKHRNACYGNHLAHSLILRDARKNKLDCCLIFEDDVEFFPNAYENLTQSLLELPYEWDMLYLGINMDQYYAHQVSDHIARLGGGFSTHAYAVRYTLFDKLIKINESKETIHNDVTYATNIMPYYNCYVTIPLVAGQRDSYSDIEGKVMSSNDMFQQRFKDRLLCG